LAAADHRDYLVKSSVPPGTIDRLQVKLERFQTLCFSPEYVGEGTYEVDWWNGTPHPTDMRKHTFHIFGGPSYATPTWVHIWQKVAGWVAVYHQTDAITAELTKYAENMFLATKKVFCTELYLTAQAMGVEYTKLRELWLLDSRIGASMTLVFPDKLAFGGKCLPKDTRALVKVASEAGHDAKLFRAVIARNDDFTA
jgi:UDPglucose 6-dehydrogenase